MSVRTPSGGHAHLAIAVRGNSKFGRKSGRKLYALRTQWHQLGFYNRGLERLYQLTLQVHKDNEKQARPCSY